MLQQYTQTADRIRGVRLIATGMATLVLCAAAARAGAHVPTPMSYRGMKNADGVPIPCVCVAEGKILALGTRICLQTPDGRQMARCELAVNVTSWVPTGAPCDVSTAATVARNM
jgi:hypothetical protein